MHQIVLSNTLKDDDLFVHVLNGVSRVQSDLTSLPLGSTQDLIPATDDFREMTETASLKNKICRNVSVLPYMNILNHGHFVNYGGSYYSYLFAKMYAAQIWHQNLAEDPLNR
jgi:hypothetical protein